jgi:hypothetical protein
MASKALWIILAVFYSLTQAASNIESPPLASTRWTNRNPSSTTRRRPKGVRLLLYDSGPSRDKLTLYRLLLARAAVTPKYVERSQLPDIH